MINKKNLWFLTLFSLVLVLSIYYVTMPNTLLESAGNDNNDLSDVSVEVEEKNIIETMKIENEEEVNGQIAELQETLTDLNVSTEDKNLAYEKLKSISENSGKEEDVENIFKQLWVKYLKDNNKISKDLYLEFKKFIKDNIKFGNS